MRQPHIINTGTYLLEPDEIPEFERDLDKIKAVEIACGTNEVYDTLWEEFDKKWEQWLIVPA